MNRVIEQLELASRLLDDVFSIGVWSESDDSSDNRNRRKGIREVDWAVADAYRSAASIETPEAQALARDLLALDKIIEVIPDTISDTMAKGAGFDATVLDLREKVAALLERARR
jgi:hypothetical protein